MMSRTVLVDASDYYEGSYIYDNEDFVGEVAMPVAGLTATLSLN